MPWWVVVPVMWSRRSSSCSPSCSVLMASSAVKTSRGCKGYVLSFVGYLSHTVCHGAAVAAHSGRPLASVFPAAGWSGRAACFQQLHTNQLSAALAYFHGGGAVAKPADGRGRAAALWFCRCHGHWCLHQYSPGTYRCPARVRLGGRGPHVGPDRQCVRGG